jgi:RHS repeat-associated protein
MSGGPLAMDSLTYHYTKGRDQLVQVNDAVGSTNYTVDIDNETSKRNYQYNGIGELAKDSAGGLDTITWTVYGKVKEIKKHNGDSIVLFYDPLGNRLEKRYYPHSATADTTKYTRDAKGNIMATYDRKKDTVRLTEWDIYGLKRIGSLDTIMRMQKPTMGVGSIDSLTLSYLEGQKQYELDNHLGNVLVTVSDKKIPVDTVSTDTLAKYYLPLVISAQDYYPFGMEQPGRTYLLNGDSAYRFAFNGKEKTNEVYGTADAYDYGARTYDPRLGRFLSTDPLTKQYPQYTPYQFSGNEPIWKVDRDGEEPDNPPPPAPPQTPPPPGFDPVPPTDVPYPYYKPTPKGADGPILPLSIPRKLPYFNPADPLAPTNIFDRYFEDLKDKGIPPEVKEKSKEEFELKRLPASPAPKMEKIPALDTTKIPKKVEPKKEEPKKEAPKKEDKPQQDKVVPPVT